MPAPMTPDELLAALRRAEEDGLPTEPIYLEQFTRITHAVWDAALEAKKDPFEELARETLKRMTDISIAFAEEVELLREEVASVNAKYAVFLESVGKGQEEGPEG